MKRLFLSLIALCALLPSMACTNFIVGKAASTDGSVFVTYNADSYGLYGNMYFHKGGTHQKGEMRKIVDWDSFRPLGEIPQASVTYTVIGQMNEHQVSITETTFGGRGELMDSTGIIDYGSLIYIGLERSKTAREAIEVMTSLVEKYGYASAGESFSICDKNEAWIMEMMPNGPGGHGVVWVAVRIPDDCISGHANQSRITKFLQLFPKEDVLYSKNVIMFARQKGYFTGKDKEFSFRDAYAPNDFSAVRICDARVWSFFNHHISGMDQYLDYILCKNINSEMPLYMKPDHKISVQDIMADMRDHFENTPLDITKDLGAGAYEAPYRATPLTKKMGDKELFNERPTSTVQTGFSFIGQMRSWLPDAVGGIVWWTNDDGNMAPYTPIYCGADAVPQCFERIQGKQDEAQFSWQSAFWVQNMVANIVYPYYSKMFPDLKAERDRLEQASLKDVTQLSTANSQQLTAINQKHADTMMKAWTDLFYFLVVRHNDIVIRKTDKDGKFLRDENGIGNYPTRPGLSDAWWNRIVKETDTRYVIPQ